MSSLTLAGIERQFTDAMRTTGLMTEDTVTADGALHRFHVEGDKRGSRDGWYVLHADGVPGGAFGHWRSGFAQTWRADMGRRLNADEERHHRERMEAAKRERDAQQQAAHAAAAERAARIWSQATPADDAHPYLIAKAVRPFSIRQQGDCLLVPLRDTTGTLHGLQYIDPDGGKKFGSGTAKAGHYHSIGAAPDDALAVVEGYATGATVHMATGWPVAVAFDAGNLLPVVLALRAKYNGALLLICADNDYRTEGNPGLTKARTAAVEVGGIVIAPAFTANSTGTDWNDHAHAYGIEATARQLDGVLREVCHVL